jgi:hypothetical protein
VFRFAISVEAFEGKPVGVRQRQAAMTNLATLALGIARAKASATSS